MSQVHSGSPSCQDKSVLWVKFASGSGWPTSRRMRFHDIDALPVVICKFTHVLILRHFKYYPAVEYKKINFYMQVVVEKFSNVTCKGTEIFTDGWSDQ